VAQAVYCVKCNKQVLKNGFKTADGDIVHGECYNCDQCGQNLVGKQVGRVPDDNGKTMLRVCYDCKMKHPYYSMGFTDADETDNQSTKPPPVLSLSNVKCAKCDKLIVGKSIKTKNDGEYHVECLVCDNCGTSLHGINYAPFKGGKWCEKCVAQRSKSVGDIAIASKNNKKALETNNSKIYNDELKKLAQNNQNVQQQLLSKGGSGQSSQPKYVGKDRICAECQKAILGPHGVEINNKIFHKTCLKCDDCNKEIEPKTTKILLDKKLCLVCSAKYTDS